MAPIALREIQQFIAKNVQPSPLRSKNRLENKEASVISSKFRHLIQQNNEILHDNSNSLAFAVGLFRLDPVTR